MYIQNNPQPFSLPKGYSGSAFEPPRSEPTEPLTPNEPEKMPPFEPPQDERQSPVEAKPEDDTGKEAEVAPTFSEQQDRRDHGLFSRLPFLSSLLPPARRGHGAKGALPEWAILGIVLLLLLDTPENDLLPFLLILLLWD